jgi:GNAT superfamily N-acetyltransferase
MNVELTLSFHPLSAPLSDKALRAYRKDAGWTVPLLHADQQLRGKIQWVAVEANGRQVGVARLELAPPEFCYVADLIITSRYRGRGIGRWFLKQIEQYCGGYGIRRLLLQAHAGTESFYELHSFVQDPLVPSFLKKDINPFQRKLFIPEHN